MDRTQAEAIVTAMLEPDLKIQQEIRRKRARHAEQLIVSRRHAWLGLVGFAAGAAIGYSTAGDNTFHGVMGAGAGLFVSALIGWMRKRRVR